MCIITYGYNIIPVTHTNAVLIEEGGERKRGGWGEKERRVGREREEGGRDKEERAQSGGEHPCKGDTQCVVTHIKL